MSLNLAAHLSFIFTEVPFPERFAAAGQAGFRGVEFLFPYDYAPERIAEFARYAGVPLALQPTSMLGVVWRLWRILLRQRSAPLRARPSTNW